MLPKALGSTIDQGGALEETSDDTDFEESYVMEAYAPPEVPGTIRSTSAPAHEAQAYRPPELPGDERNAGTDTSEHAAVFTGDEPDSYGVSKLRQKQDDSYEPPELPLDEEVYADIEQQELRENSEPEYRSHETPSPNGATATIRPRSGDKRSIYVPPPTPPALEITESDRDETTRPKNGDKRSVYVPPPTPPALETPEVDRDETDARGRSSRSSRTSEPRYETTTVVVEQSGRGRAPDTRSNGNHEAEVPPRFSVTPDRGKQV